MWLVARKAAQRRFDFANIGWVHHVGDGVAIHRVSNAITKRQHRNPVFLVVVVGKLDRPVEDGKQVRGVVPLRSGFWTMALQAKRIALGAQQVIVVAAVRRVAR